MSGEFILREPSVGEAVCGGLTDASTSFIRGHRWQLPATSYAFLQRCSVSLTCMKRGCASWLHWMSLQSRTSSQEFGATDAYGTLGDWQSLPSWQVLDKRMLRGSHC